MHQAPATPIAALLAALAVLPLAGCIGGLGADEVAAPMADLKANNRTPWAGEAVTFDGQASSAPEGAAVLRWRFDFGDGTVVDVDSEDEARLKHAYAAAGRYVATLTVETHQGNEAPRRDATSLVLGVRDRIDVEATLVKDPVGIDQGANDTVSFTVRDGALGFALNASVHGATAVGSSRGTATVMDPTGAILASFDFVVDAGQDQEVVLEGPLERIGTHELRLNVESGAVDVRGALEVSYRAT